MNKVTAGDFKNYQAHTQRQLVKPASDFLDKAQVLLEQGIHLTGDKMPWERTHDKFRFREGEVTIWSGINGNGKSQVMGQVALWLIKTTNVLIASMEMKGEVTVARLLRQGYGGAKPDADFYKRFKDETDLRLWIYDATDTVQSNDILAMIDWSAEQNGVKHIMIDSLMMCGVNQDDNESQKNFVGRLTTKAKQHNIHIHLVTHCRKSPVGMKDYFPGKFDIAGSSTISNLAFNIIIIHLNEQKQIARDNKEVLEFKDPDAFMRIAKQRNGEFTGTWGFWYDLESLQWTDDDAMSLRYSPQNLPIPMIW
jgi:twinkle protein